MGGLLKECKEEKNDLKDVFNFKICIFIYIYLFHKTNRRPNGDSLNYTLRYSTKT